MTGDELTEWLPTRRWFASKSLEISGVEVLDSYGDAIELVQVSFSNGTHAIYQLVSEDQLLELIAAGARHAGFSCFDVGGAAAGFGLGSGDAGAALRPRPIGAEQSNSTFVYGEHLALKVFRRLEAGINPELEMLRFLSARDYPNIAPLRGWYEYEGQSLAATLGVLQDYVSEAQDGWSLALAEIPAEPERFLGRAHSLGAATAELHNVLATDNEDPAFAPEEPSAESVALLVAKIDEDIGQMFMDLPEDARLAPIAARGAAVRERLAERPQMSTGGRYIRLHGDFHLGQTLARRDGSWVLLDFEGEPARTLSERRMKRSPLRDVASMLRSFDYAVAAVSILGGQSAPEGYEEQARGAFLDSYFAEIDQALLPGGDSAVANLLAIFELEKAIYELRYELDNRPDWVSIPVRGIERLLEQA